MACLKLRLLAAVSIVLTLWGPLSAQEPSPGDTGAIVQQVRCGDLLNPEGEIDRDYVDCLEQRIDDLLVIISSALSISRDALVGLHALDAPKKTIVKSHGMRRMAVTRAKADGKRVGDAFCLTPHPQPTESNLILIGGELFNERPAPRDGPEVRIPLFNQSGVGRGVGVQTWITKIRIAGDIGAPSAGIATTGRGCLKDKAHKDWCNASNEECFVLDQAPACVVNRDWWDWYRKQAANFHLPMDGATLCRPVGGA